MKNVMMLTLLGLTACLTACALLMTVLAGLNEEEKWITGIFAAVLLLIASGIGFLVRDKASTGK